MVLSESHQLLHVEIIHMIIRFRNTIRLFIQCEHDLPLQTRYLFFSRETDAAQCQNTEK